GVRRINGVIRKLLSKPTGHCNVILCGVLKRRGSQLAALREIKPALLNSLRNIAVTCGINYNKIGRASCRERRDSARSEDTQAEHAIRARNVTGVQTCALPIYGVRRINGVIRKLLSKPTGHCNVILCGVLKRRGSQLAALREIKPALLNSLRNIAVTCGINYN